MRKETDWNGTFSGLLATWPATADVEPNFSQKETLHQFRVNETQDRADERLSEGRECHGATELTQLCKHPRKPTRTAIDCVAANLCLLFLSGYAEHAAVAKLRGFGGLSLNYVTGEEKKKGF